MIFTNANASSARLKVEAERTAMLIWAENLKLKQELEREKAALKAKKEELILKTAIAMANAKLDLLTVKESAVGTMSEFKKEAAAFLIATTQVREGSFICADRIES